MRVGCTLIGQSVAAAIITNWRWPGKARVALDATGAALVEAAANDIGTWRLYDHGASLRADLSNTVTCGSMPCSWTNQPSISAEP